MSLSVRHFDNRLIDVADLDSIQGDCGKVFRAIGLANGRLARAMTGKKQEQILRFAQDDKAGGMGAGRLKLLQAGEEGLPDVAAQGQMRELAFASHGDQAGVLEFLQVV